MSKMVRGGVETAHTIGIAVEQIGHRHKVSVLRRQYAGPDSRENSEAVLVTASAADWAVEVRAYYDLEDQGLLGGVESLCSTNHAGGYMPTWAAPAHTTFDPPQ